MPPRKKKPEVSKKLKESIAQVEKPKPFIIEIVAIEDTRIHQSAIIKGKLLVADEDLGSDLTKGGKYLSIRGTIEGFNINKLNVVSRPILPDEELLIQVINMRPHDPFMVRAGDVIAHLLVQY